MTEVQSPFLHNTQIQYAWDSTSLGAFKTCPRYYQYTILEGWQPHGENIHLRFGIEYHKALEEYDRYRQDWAHEESLRMAVSDLLKRIHLWEPEPRAGKRSEEMKTKDHLIRTVIWYLDKFPNDPAQTYIMADGRPAVEVSFRFELGWGPESAQSDAESELQEECSFTPQPYILCGHLDRVVTFADDLYFMDRKTTTTTPGSYYFDQFDPNNQMTLYTLASQIILQSPIRGGIIDAAQIGEGFSRFVRGFTYRTKEQIDEWVNDLASVLIEAEKYAIDGYWPMRDTSCGMYGGCRFRDICSKSPPVRLRFLESNFKQLEPEERWNPLKPR